MLGFNAFHSAAATLAGIEAAHMIRKGRFGQTNAIIYHPRCEAPQYRIRPVLHAYQPLARGRDVV